MSIAQGLTELGVFKSNGSHWLSSLLHCADILYEGNKFQSTSVQLLIYQWYLDMHERWGCWFYDRSMLALQWRRQWRVDIRPCEPPSSAHHNTSEFAALLLCNINIFLHNKWDHEKPLTKRLMTRWGKNIAYLQYQSINPSCFLLWPKQQTST